MRSFPDHLGRVRGVAVGHATDPSGASGVSAILFPGGAPSVVDVRGGASATYDTASLALEATFGRRWALFFSGGSLFGLDAARGVRTRLLETGEGTAAFARGPTIVPVSGAALYDLRPGGEGLPDYLALGYEAARTATAARMAQGRVGAGAGATVGKYLGRARAMAGGVGSASAPSLGRSRVGVLVAVNAVGAIRDPSTGRWLAAARGPRGAPVPPGAGRRGSARGLGTTLCAVVTDLDVGRPALARIAGIVHAGLGRTIVPYLTATDGDVVFASATGRAGPPPAEPFPGRTADRVGALAADLAVRAVARAVAPER